MERKASAVWRGSFKETGGGTEYLESARFRISRIRLQPGLRINPGTCNQEELIAAAHAGCFSMVSLHLTARDLKQRASVHTGPAGAARRKMDDRSHSFAWLVRVSQELIRQHLKRLRKTAEARMSGLTSSKAKVTIDATLQSESKAAD